MAIERIKVGDHFNDFDVDERAEFLSVEEKKLEGDQFEGTFKGIGWITSGQVEGSYLSSHNSEMRRSEDMNPFSEISLAINDLLPEAWDESKVEFEITVRARKISD